MKQLFLLLFLSIIVPSFAKHKNQSVGFIENKGQIVDQNGKPNPAVQYLLNSNGLNVQIKKNGFSYDIYETKKHPLTKSQKSKLPPISPLEKHNYSTPNFSLEYIYHRVDIDFVNSNQNAVLISEEKSTDYDNYYNVPNKPEGVLDVHKYKQITYQNIYPNIDVVFSIPKDSLKPVEYNFVVHPNGKISDIQLKFSGAKTELNDNKIKMKVRFGEMEETLPMSWTENGNNKKEIAVGYKKIKNNVYGFESDSQIAGQTVIIDPVPTRLWGTYYGGNGNEFAFDISTNNNNNVFIAGNTWSSINIATAGTYSSNLTGDSNMFFAKFDTNGNRIWGTYFYYENGIFQSHTPKIIADSNDNLYVAAEEQFFSNSATIGAFQTTKNNYSDVILIKLNNLGGRDWATYYGGNGNESARTICLDKDNNIYIGGETTSTDVFASPNAYQIKNNSLTSDYSDAFIAKFNSNGQRIWGTFYGGLGSDGFYNLSISDDGFLFASGTQNSVDSIATPNAYQTTTSTLNYGGMIVKFDLSGQRIWGTYIVNDSFLYDAKLIGDNLYFTAQTDNNSFGTIGSFHKNIQTLPSDSSLSANINSFIGSFNIQSLHFNWGTYFFEGIRSIDVNQNNEVYICGETFINSGITTPNAYMPIKNNYIKGYLIKLNSVGQRVWGTYYGGNYAEQLCIAKIDNQQNIYIFGNTNGSTTGIATTNAYQSSLSSNPDTFIAKFKDCQSIVTAISNSPICIGKPLELKASGGTNYAWTGPNGFTSTDQNPTIPNATAVNSGQYSCAITGSGDCDDTKTVDVIVGDTVAPIPNLATLPTITGDCHTIITTIPTANDSCAGAIMATTTSPLSYSLTGTYTIVWGYDDGNGNMSSQNQTVTISSQPLPTLTSPQNFCIQQNATLSTITITGQNIKWYDASINGTLLSNTTVLQNGITYYASQTINGCESDRVSVVINIQNTSAPTGNSNQTFCSSQNPTLDTINILGTAIKWYDNASSGLLLANTTSIQDGITYYASQTEKGCESVSRLPIKISLINTLPSNNYDELICDDLNDGKEIVNLTTYNSNIIANTSGYTFSYYHSTNGAENELVADKITNASNYQLLLGSNKVYVRINSKTPCYAVAVLNLTVVAKPIIAIADIVPICENSAISISGGSNKNSYLWSTGETTPSITVLNPGDFSVIVTKKYGEVSCSSTKSFTVKKSDIATITSIETQDWTDNENVITVYVTGTGDFEYSIDGIQFQNSNQFLNVHSGEYTVNVRDKNGCGTATDEVYLLMFPKFFTPNSDGYNDTWSIKFSDFEAGLNVKIFDRYGKLLKILENNAAWDGTYNGRELIASDYWFTVTRANGKEYKGHFSLKR